MVPAVRPAPVIAEEAAACVRPATVGTVTCAVPEDTTRFTALPTLTCVPADGLELITEPAGAVALACLVIVPTVRPAPVIAVDAAACVRPATVGTATCAGPEDTTRLTALPTLTCVPADVVQLIIEPDGTVALDCLVIVPTVRPAPVIAVDAAACVRPATVGTATCAGPDETTRVTALTTLTCLPADGVELITEPDGTVALDCVVMVPTVRPAPVIAVDAAACVRPPTVGTATCAGPEDTTRFTALPTLTCVPADGVELITEPAATVALDCVVIVPTVRPAPVMAVDAAACVRPATVGTATCAGPDETTRFTALPTLTCVPADGVELITEPDGTVALDC